MAVGENLQDIKRVITSPGYYISIFGGALIATFLVHQFVMKKKITNRQILGLILIYGLTISLTGILSMYAAYYAK
jgi:hypothetical protein